MKDKKKQEPEETYIRVSENGVVETYSPVWSGTEELHEDYGKIVAECVIHAFGKLGAAPLTKDKIIKTANDAANRFVTIIKGKA